mmetsp:Transcript_60079/g.168423  ORF Transcript_60079/g.168423 Transcript_60079/m.168423 type:complete len:228 (+) Transcript_60079:2345-3028(+)
MLLLLGIPWFPTLRHLLLARWRGGRQAAKPELLMLLPLRAGPMLNIHRRRRLALALALLRTGQHRRCVAGVLAESRRRRIALGTKLFLGTALGAAFTHAGPSSRSATFAALLGATGIGTGALLPRPLHAGPRGVLPGGPGSNACNRRAGRAPRRRPRRGSGGRRRGRGLGNGRRLRHRCRLRLLESDPNVLRLLEDLLLSFLLRGVVRIEALEQLLGLKILRPLPQG